eukprot:TRINITY_DN5703_c0_g1_i3.p1 TRINITY_DN5703_c0_g1~~TRINITY_DN5703_c0_g1_i3.p1  ORF type:complete len:156 (+),score=68.57 TRINITY_DN5703_c0_g1_i3:76-543(+)
MKILSRNEGIITNWEVYHNIHLIKTRENSLKGKANNEENKLNGKEEVVEGKEEQKKENVSNSDEDSRVPKELKMVRLFENKVYEYLLQTKIDTVSPQDVKKIGLAVKPYDLTKGETLQILNLRPKSVSALSVIVEEIADRLDSEQTEQLLEDIQI